jgi:parvulin-like peptidyl-prolyl isomerase
MSNPQPNTHAKRSALRRCVVGILLTSILGLGAWLLLRQRDSYAQIPPEPEAKPSNIAATVNGEKISLQELDDTVNSRPTLQPATQAQLRQSRIETLTGLIDVSLMRQYLKEHGPKIEQAEIDKYLQMMAAAQKQKNKTMQDYLLEMNRTEAQLRDSILMALQLDKYLNDQLAKADLRKYYEANRDYFDKVVVRTSHIVIRLPSDAPEGERTRTRDRLASIRADIGAGKIDFAAAAKQNSDCPSAPNGGDIGYILRKGQNVDPAYCQAAFTMKVGELSQIVETGFGLHLIQLTDRKEGKPSRYEDCVDEIRALLKEESRQDLLKAERKKAKIEITIP